MYDFFSVANDISSRKAVLHTNMGGPKRAECTYILLCGAHMLYIHTWGKSDVRVRKKEESMTGRNRLLLQVCTVHTFMVLSIHYIRYICTEDEGC